MSLVKAQCTNCGGKLEVDSTKDAAICPFCNTPYIVEKAIQQFNINNTNYIQNAVFYNTKESETELLTRGLKQLELNVWEDAGETFRQMTKQYPANYKGWLGLCVVDANTSEQTYDTEDLRKNAISQCPDNKKEVLFGAVVRSEERIQALTNSIQECNNRINKTQKTIDKLNNNISKNDKDSTIKFRLSWLALIGALIGGVILTVSISGGIISLILDAAVWYYLYRLSMGADGEWRNFSDENRRYAKRITEYNEEIEFEKNLLENLQLQLKAEEHNKESRYFIELMKT